MLNKKEFATGSGMKVVSYEGYNCVLKFRGFSDSELTHGILDYTKSLVKVSAFIDKGEKDWVLYLQLPRHDISLDEYQMVTDAVEDIKSFWKEFKDIIN